MPLLCVSVCVLTAMEDLLQFFSSEASAQSMTWLHHAELGTQLPSLHDDSDEPHVTSAVEDQHFKERREQKQHSQTDACSLEQYLDSSVQVECNSYLTAMTLCALQFSSHVHFIFLHHQSAIFCYFDYVKKFLFHVP